MRLHRHEHARHQRNADSTRDQPGRRLHLARLLDHARREARLRARRHEYAEAKAGGEGVTVALGRELGPRGATVNTVAPGYIAETRFFGDGGVAPAIAATIREQTPAGRAGHPDNIADAAAWLAGPRASFVTGATIAVNGGWRVG